MKVTTTSSVPVYTISGSSTARPLPEWLARKRKRSLKQDPEYANRVELLQDFEFEEASTCIRVSEDGDWIMSTGTYKPQMHVHYLPHLALSYARHTNTLNHTFVLLSSDYTKSLHLQTDRSLEFHTAGACRHATRIPRYGRDLKYDRWSAEALVPSVGTNSNGNGEVYRMNLELGRFMTPYEVDVGGDDTTNVASKTLQGDIDTGSVNCAAIGEDSHNLLAFGTSLGTVEFWDTRSRSRVSVLPRPPTLSSTIDPLNGTRPEITCLEFKSSGLTLASGTSTGLIHLYDLRSPTPLLRKDQGYGYPIHTLTFLDSQTSSTRLTAGDKILSSDRRIIKIWDSNTGTPWTSVEPAVDINSVAWCRDSGMLLTANEGRQQHSFFIPSLGPAPKWCSFLDNLVEEMAEDVNDPNAYTAGGAAAHKAGEMYDNYRFVAVPELRALNLEHLIGRTGLLKPMMHGYLVNQQLYEEARLISQPELWAERRQKSIRERIEKERESRIRGSKKAVTAKVNKRLAERILEREEKHERRKAKRVLEKGMAEQDKENQQQREEEHQQPQLNGDTNANDTEETQGQTRGILSDARFSALFQNEDFTIDETSREFQMLNPSTNPNITSTTKDTRKRGLTAVEEEELEERRRNGEDSGDDSSDGESSQDEDQSANNDENDQRHQRRGNGANRPNKFASNTNNKNTKISSSTYRKSGHESQQQDRRAPRMLVSSSSAATAQKPGRRDRSFGARVGAGEAVGRNGRANGGGGGATGGAAVVGEKSISFMPSGGRKQGERPGTDTGAGGQGRGGFGSGRGRGGGGRGGRGGGPGGRQGDQGGERRDRRSASGNVFRRM